MCQGGTQKAMFYSLNWDGGYTRMCFNFKLVHEKVYSILNHEIAILYVKSEQILTNLHDNFTI